MWPYLPHLIFQDCLRIGILDALINIGFYPDSGLTELNSYENRVFSLWMSTNNVMWANFDVSTLVIIHKKEEHEFVFSAKKRHRFLSQRLSR